MHPVVAARERDRLLQVGAAVPLVHHPRGEPRGVVRGPEPHPRAGPRLQPRLEATVALAQHVELRQPDLAGLPHRLRLLVVAPPGPLRGLRLLLRAQQPVDLLLQALQHRRDVGLHFSRGKCFILLFLVII